VEGKEGLKTRTIHSNCNGGLESINIAVLDQIDSIFSSLTIAIKNFAVSKINHEVSLRLKEFGWSDLVRLAEVSKITITSIRDDIGLCMQTGNVSRIYADLLKLQSLYAKNIIKSAIIIVPTGKAARKLGSNVASFERLCRELPIFAQVITLPIVIIAFEE